MTYRVHGMGPHGGLRTGGLTREAADTMAEDFAAQYPSAVAHVIEESTGVAVGVYGPKQKALPTSRSFEKRTR